LVFNFFGFLVVFGLQFFQSKLPLNPQHLPDVGPALSFNTAVSFMTNTNWQSYSGENTLSYLVQCWRYGTKLFKRCNRNCDFVGINPWN